MLRNLVGAIATISILPSAVATEFTVTITDEQVRLVRDRAEHSFTKSYASDAMIREGLELVCRQFYLGRSIYEVAEGQYKVTKEHTGMQKESLIDYFLSLNTIAIFATCPQYVNDPQYKR